MAWIPTVSDDEATGLCAEIFERIRSKPEFMGQIPNIMRSLSLRPEVLDSVSRKSSVVTFGGSGLSRQEEEMISTVVSSINHCHY